MGKDLSCYSNKIQPTNKAYLIDITVANISQSFTNKHYAFSALTLLVGRQENGCVCVCVLLASIDMELNYATVILCILDDVHLLVTCERWYCLNLYSLNGAQIYPELELRILLTNFYSAIVLI